MKVVRSLLSVLVFLGASGIGSAEEHCLVVQAMAVTGYDQRMELLLGTDQLFDRAYRTLKAATNQVSEKYKALFVAKNQEYETQNPENHGGQFKSAVEREEFFRHWHNDMTTLQEDRDSELEVVTGAFDRAIAADREVETRRRIAEIRAKWNKELNLPCYWGALK